MPFQKLHRVPPSQGYELGLAALQDACSSLPLLPPPLYTRLRTLRR